MKSRGTRKSRKRLRYPTLVNGRRFRSEGSFKQKEGGHPTKKNNYKKPPAMRGAQAPNQDSLIPEPIQHKIAKGAGPEMAGP